MLFKNLPDQAPFQLFEQYYQDAENNNQPIAEAGCISSVDKDGKPHSRFVNFKYFLKIILFSFQVIAVIKLKTLIKSKRSNKFLVVKYKCSDKARRTNIKMLGKIFRRTFLWKRDWKNIAAIVSNQSREIESYEVLEAKYEKIKSDIEEGRIDEIRPEDWGGFQISVSYFEFWEANNDRLNYRECYSLEQGEWRKFFLQS
ncbi:MAG: hypothetical protein CM15mP12_9190 [Gammaproteobacteria bacterium]|nr:MAG: hypothetical protein CM15mP12_9190 [Gammaproteobacteria bacterium]